MKRRRSHQALRITLRCEPGSLPRRRPRTSLLPRSRSTQDPRVRHRTTNMDRKGGCHSCVLKASPSLCASVIYRLLRNNFPPPLYSHQVQEAGTHVEPYALCHASSSPRKARFIGEVADASERGADRDARNQTLAVESCRPDWRTRLERCRPRCGTRHDWIVADRDAEAAGVYCGSVINYFLVLY